MVPLSLRNRNHNTYLWCLPNMTYLPKFTKPNWRGFNRIYATGVACQQGTLNPPDTWSCPTLGLASVLMLIPISPELVLFPDFWFSNIPRYSCFLLWKISYFHKCFIVIDGLPSCSGKGKAGGGGGGINKYMLYWHEFSFNIMLICRGGMLICRGGILEFKFEFIGSLRHMQRYFSHIYDGTDVQVDWRRSPPWGRRGLKSRIRPPCPRRVVKGD